ncbi:25S rRNA (adenine-N(1))-methyltransferase [Exophiala dermatitidis]
MFAVPGWAVSPAALVPESQPSKTGEKTKKRKNTHPDGDHAAKVTGTELEKLWNQRKASETAERHSGTQEASSKARRKSKETAAPESQSKGQGTPAVSKHKDKDKDKDKNKNKKRIHEENTTSEAPAQDSKSSQHSHSRDNKTEASGKAGKKSVDGSRNSNGKNGQTETPSQTTSTSAEAVIKALPPVPTPAKLTPLQAKMRSKLTSARFRHLNETLYTTSSTAAMDLFTHSPDLFAEYHAGFSQQVKDSWPQNPVDQYIATIKRRGQSQGNDSLPRRKTGTCTIADLGCGDAPLARGCQSQIKNLKLKFHNFDLHAPNSHVTKADIANLPLRDGEVDVAVFCLSLMGTNWLSFVEEAWRILRGDGKGEVWVSEVKSRFGRVTKGPGHVVENSVGKRRKNPKKKKFSGPEGSGADPDPLDGEEEVFADAEGGAAAAIQDDTDISAFVKVFSRRGFVLRPESVDKSNKMFVSMVFVKSGVPSAGKHKWLKWNGHEYKRVHDGKMRFITKGDAAGAADDDDVSPEEEAKVLKPCVYKTR